MDEQDRRFSVSISSHDRQSAHPREMGKDYYFLAAEEFGTKSAGESL